MENYTFLRALADSWVLLVMFGFFVGVILWAWRPGSRPIHDAAAQVPFDHETAPAISKGPQS
jgi:cytochrome c oxidase cbb3-type subunit IV